MIVFIAYKLEFIFNYFELKNAAQFSHESDNVSFLT